LGRDPHMHGKVGLGRFSVRFIIDAFGGVGAHGRASLANGNMGMIIRYGCEWLKHLGRRSFTIRSARGKYSV